MPAVTCNRPLVLYDGNRKAMLNYTPQDIARFNSKILKTETCWIWQAACSRDGYGSFWINGFTRRAHRVSWEISNGQAIPEGMDVLHNCPDGDNPKCVNPEHLWIGTVVDNMADKKQKGRCQSGDDHYLRRHPEAIKRGDQHPLRLHPEFAARGEKVNTAKLTNEAIIEIRRLYATGNYSHPQLGKMFGVAHSTIGRIVRGEYWKHI